MPVSIDAAPRPGTTSTLLGQDDGGLVRRTVLPGGLRVVTEHMPGVRSATIGIWVGVGSRDETIRQSGASHFLEHLLFKGTPTRSALDISAALDEVGGEMNAFTAKEYTCYHARVLDEDLPLAVDVLADMVVSSVVATDDVESEREVILEEIAMNEDDPDDVVHNLAIAQAWGDTPLGRSVAGEPDTVRSLGRDPIRRFYRRHYTPDALVVAVAGNVDHAAVVRGVRRAFASVLGADVAPRARRTAGARPTPFRPGVSLAERPTEQANVVLGVPGLARGDRRRYALGVLNAALGGGMSSRLFQEVRENRGLAYSVYSFAQGFADAGMIGLYVGCAPAKVDQALEVCRAELLQVSQHGLTDDEVKRGRGQMRGTVVLGLEDPGSRMSRIGKADLLHGELASVDEVLRSIDAVTPDEVREVATLLAADPAVAVVGPFDDADRFSALV
ncbi:MAG: pitrilysin family protein [Nocardioidaceae bacterium]|nr:pitrilysin family protein [Nocardioidaceae bacterium]